MKLTAAFLAILLALVSTLLASPSCWARHLDDAELAGYNKSNHHGGDSNRWDRHDRQSRRGFRKSDLRFDNPREILRTEGGALYLWSERVEAIRNAHVGISELHLEQGGLLVPQYADADKIAYVIEGWGWMGAAIPIQGEFRRKFVRRVGRGDVIALPKGVVYWWYNDGNERHRIFCASDTSEGVNPGRYHQFALAGAQQEMFGSVLHGFSRDMLAAAWGIDEGTVGSLLEGQNDVGIVKVERRIEFPEPREEREYYEPREEREYYDYYDYHFDNSEEQFRHHDDPTRYFEELTYSTRNQNPDLYVENGGWLQIVNRHKLPVLEGVRFSAMRVVLENNAMCAPSFVRNAHQILFITRGEGRIQVVSNDGETIYDEDVREGNVLVIPQFFPSVKIAGNDGLEWVNLLTSDRPSPSFLAGRNSVYRGVPLQVMAAALNVDERALSDMAMRSSRRDQEVIFPGQRGVPYRLNGHRDSKQKLMWENILLAGS